MKSWRTKPNMAMVEEADKLWASFKKEGGSVLRAYWTLGRYDAIVTVDATK